MSSLEGEVDALETLIEEMVAGMLSNRLGDAGLVNRTIDERRAKFTIRQHNDLIVGTLGEYSKGAIQVLDKIEKELPG